MKNARVVVRRIMCGAGAHQRFTQESPILPDVWAEYLEYGPRHRARLLIEPWSEIPPYKVAERMGVRMKTAFGATQTIYNRTILASELTLNDLLINIIPMTGWYINIVTRRTGERRNPTPEKSREPKQRPDAPQSPTAAEMWEDIVRPLHPSYPFPELLSLIRMAGIIGYLAIRPRQENEVMKRLEELGSADSKIQERGRNKLVEYVRIGLAQGLKLKTLPKPEADGVIFSVNRNRKAMLALKNSVKTVKADAAKRVFDIECKKMTWAIIDCGIDARHPAFLDRAEMPEDTQDPALRLKHSRVTETYDFTGLQNLLLGQKLPKHYLQGEGTKDPDRLLEIERRIQRSQNVDWELLRPFLRVSHDPKEYKPPTDSHGTHVAGILGANWPRGGEGNEVHGMCGDIRILDLRVCREDGTSDEFIIISAMQFLRHLNGNAESPYILGANVSLSIPHDVTAFACGQTQVCREAERTVASGVVVVAAAGNLGYRRMLDEYSDSIEQYCAVSITDPGNAECVITVGSTHRSEPHTYGVSYFSSRGPTGDGRNKPDLLAPGEKIRAPALDDKTLPLDGTSMAAPHVSGAAALLMARHVELKGQPDRVKKILCETATDLGRERYFQGHGLVDVLRAIQSV